MIKNSNHVASFAALLSCALSSIAENVTIVSKFSEKTNKYSYNK